MNRFGQWAGSFGGTSGGLAFLSVEVDAPTKGVLTTVQGPDIPPTRTEFSLEWASEGVSAKSTATSVFDVGSKVLLSPDEFKRRYPESIGFLDDITVRADIAGSTMKGSWNGSNNRGGSFQLENTVMQPAGKSDRCMTWAQYKEFVQELIESGSERYFRGHAESSWKLSTTFHRLHRYDLLRYEAECLPEIRHRINAMLRTRYNFEDGEDFGALLSLLQHHGFPTPLSDWTSSPYVAAFFAFEAIPRNIDPGGFCRIFVFDGRRWMSDFPWAASFANPTPLVTVNAFQAINNPRYLPQQAIHLFSNVHDIEWWMRKFGELRSKSYLTVIDLSHAERKRAMRELDFMGISAATLFPDIDGLCRSLREKFFLRT